MAASPSRARARFGGFLKTVRQEAEVSPTDAARMAKVSVSNLNRYEAGEVALTWGTAWLLLNSYGASPARVAEAERLFEYIKDEPRSIRLPVGTPKAFRKLINAEREAPAERALAPYVMPALLQHKRYAEALIASEHNLKRAKISPDKALVARLNRQTVFDRPDPLQMHALIDEAVLHREIGGPDVLREQLAHLLVLAARPNITLQVVRFTAGSYGTMNGPFTIVDYPEPGTAPGVYLEYPAGGDWVDDSEDVQRFTAMFDDITELANTAADTTDLIHQRLKQLASR